MKRRFTALAIFSILLATMLVAQNNSPKAFGIVLFAEGDELTVFRANVLTSYSVIADNTLGMRLLPGDLVQTGPGTYLEIQLIPSQTIIKIAENTSFRITGLAQASGSTLDVVYGRIRAKVDATLGKPGFAIRGQTAVAGVRGTEFGYDVIATPGIGNEPSSQIYCLSGTVKVVPLQADDLTPQNEKTMVNNASLDQANSFTLSPNQMLTVYDAPDEASRANIKTEDGQDTVSEAGNRTIVFSKAIKSSVKGYWKKHEIKSVALTGAEIAARYGDNQDNSLENIGPADTQENLADTISPLPTIDPLKSLSPKQYALQKDNDKVAGIVMLSLGLASDIFGFIVYSYGPEMGFTARDAQTTGIVCMSSGVFLNITGIIGFIAGLSR